MDAVNIRVAASFALGALVLAVTVSTEVRAQALAVDPAATQLLRRMTDYLAGLEQFSLDTQNTIEDVLESGQKIQRDIATSVVIRRPNKLRAEREGDLIDQVVFYDGKRLTIYNPAQNYYAVSPAPDTLDDALHFARDALDIVPPSGDLIYNNAFELLTANVTSGMVVGKSIIGDVKCDHLAFSGPVVDWQIWIADGEQPLPRKYVITTKDDPAQPQYMVLMNHWNVAPDMNDALFHFVPPQGAKQIDFIRLDSSRMSIRSLDTRGTQ
nr:DUF2092 domain-containing protein [Gammaproteobacteria bacterium]